MKSMVILSLSVCLSLGGNSAWAQFGGGGLGGIGGAPLQPVERPIAVITGRGWGVGYQNSSPGAGAIVIVPKEGKRVWGFSATTGKWSSVELEEGDVSEVIPAAGNGAAGFRVGRWAYGFGELAGRWDKIQISRDALPDDSTAMPILGNNILAIQNGRVACAFSIEHGKWDRVVLPKSSTAYVSVQNHMVTLSDNEKFFYAFSETSQEWGGVNMENGEMLSIQRELPE